MTAVLAIGGRAHAALRESGGVAHPLAEFPDAPYFDAAGEIIWVGSKLPARHPRAVLTAAPVARGRVASFGTLPRNAWRGVLPPLLPDPRPVEGCMQRMLARIDALGAPRGFGALLAGRTPEFPLDLAAGRVQALADAYRSDDADAAVVASRALLGLGTGLTPSGDDLCGAALFGRRLRSRDARWRAAGRRIAREAEQASHAISAALLADLASGCSFESLHALSAALAAGDDAAALEASRALVSLGHSSGWDMLAGFTIGLTGSLQGTAT